MDGPVSRVFMPRALQQVAGDASRAGLARRGRGCARGACVGPGSARADLAHGKFRFRAQCLHLAFHTGFRLRVRCADGLQEARADLGRADQQERTDGVECGLTVGPGDDRVRDIQGESGEAGEDKQSAGWSKLCRCRAVEGEMPGPEQESENRQIDRGGDQGRDPDGHAESQGEVEHVAEAEQEG